eukprot:TRINITY_DN122881_c0_g1_i1.p1 TRINITY_DN122881_c0_g1~~TRINITY_DN122881_c0_g1_i1.p1  ORF type:complete len:260 (-),score=86.01 TRINITY_DN122881_c0_g1_i1:294-1004(-)
MAVLMRRRRITVAVVATASVAVAICLKAAQLSSAFVPGAQRAPAADARQPDRRGLLLGGLAGAALATAPSQPAHAKGTPGALDVVGRAAKHPGLEGRWSAVLGQQINKRAVYKRDGEAYYLLFNDCGKFQMSEKLSGECGGFGTNEDGGWVIDGEKNPSIKVSPAGKKTAEELEATEEAKERKVKKDEAMKAFAEEKERIEREASVMTFRGVMDQDLEDIGDRLLGKLGAKIVPGM